MRRSLEPLLTFVEDMSRLLDAGAGEERILADGGDSLRRLLAVDDWLPSEYARPDALRYRQYRLYGDPQGRFSVLSFVWGPGQATPVHDHTVWGLVGVLRGAEISQPYTVSAGGLLAAGAQRRLLPGEIDAVSPRIGDLHRVFNPLEDRPSVSIHCYGGDIGTLRRSSYDASGAARPFVSGYSAAPPLDLALGRRGA